MHCVVKLDGGHKKTKIVRLFLFIALLAHLKLNIPIDYSFIFLLLLINLISVETPFLILNFEWVNFECFYINFTNNSTRS